MSDERMFELLAKHPGPADADKNFEERLFSVLQDELRRRRSPRVALLLVAALTLLGLLGATVVGAGLVQLPIVVVPPVATSSAQPVATPTAPTTDRGTMLATHFGHTASLLPDGGVLVTGGFGDYGAEVYDPDRRRWTATADMVALRDGHTATLLRDGTVLVVGGADTDMRPAHTSAEIYDPVQDTWTATGSMVSPRAHHTATLLPDGRVLVAGGGDDHDTIGPAHASVEIYDPATGLWTATGDMNQPRGNHSATLLDSGSLLVAGGRGGDPETAELYDPARGTWSYTGSMMVGRGSHAAVHLADGTVLVLGGDPYVGTLDATLVGEIYDPGAGSWTSLPQWGDGVLSFGERAPARPALVVLRNGKVLAAEASTVDVWDPVTREWTPAPPLRSPEDWYDYSATLLGDGTVLMAGGWEAGEGGERPSSRYERYAPPSD